MESDKKSTNLAKSEKAVRAENLAQHNVDENLSRPTHHDSNLTTGMNPAFDSTLNQATTTNLGLPGQGFSTFGTSNLQSSIPITQENEFAQRNLGGQFGGTPMTGSQFVSGNQFVSGTQFTSGNQFTSSNIAASNLGTGLPQGSLASEIPIYTTTTGGEAVEGEEAHKKKGFFSKIGGIFHHKKDKDVDMRAEEGYDRNVHNVEHLRNEPPGILDEKGTTVSMPSGTQSNAQLGLPVWGPDYTHGTHGTTTHTVFTGGQTGMGLESNLATTSMPVPLEGVQSGSFQPGLSTGSFEPGLESGIHKRGIDLSGANATHIDRDITLQEGGLLGLRQGAVTGNPGDIITNYMDRGDLDMPSTKITTMPVMQPVATTTVTTTVIEQPIVREELRDVTSQHLGSTGYGLGPHSCTLVKGDQNQFNQNKF